jgi:hypothetical protein
VRKTADDHISSCSPIFSKQGDPRAMLIRPMHGRHAARVGSPRRERAGIAHLLATYGDAWRGIAESTA